jgi:hypothetical protein
MNTYDLRMQSDEPAADNPAETPAETPAEGDAPAGSEGAE